MAQRRMFSPDIVCSEEFLDMPASSRELYFQLGMRADDDGFIQPKFIMKTVGASDDDLKVLLTKRFLLPFKSGVVVIKHWLIHNMIRADRYKPSRFVDEKKTLFIKENKAYTDKDEDATPLLATKWQPTGNHPAPQVRLGKVINTTRALSAGAKKKAMKANKMGKYREDESSDGFETVIDADSGQERTEAKRPSVRKAYDYLINWAVKRRGSDFVNMGKQFKALEKMRKAKIDTEPIMRRWEELERDPFYKDKGIDFMTVASSFDRKAP